MSKISKITGTLAEHVSCYASYIQTLIEEIDAQGDEIQQLKTDVQEMTHQYDDAYSQLAEMWCLHDKLKSADTLIDHQAEIIRKVRQLIIDNIVITADRDGNEEMNIIAYKPDTDKILELLSITEEDYTEC